jgi:formamidopyrimidine-DNA glycosylase
MTAALRFHDTANSAVYLVKTLRDHRRFRAGTVDPSSPDAIRGTFAARQRIVETIAVRSNLLAGLGNIYVDEPCGKPVYLPSCHHRCLRLREYFIPGYSDCVVARLKNLGTTLGPGELNFYSVAGVKP